jgi:DNA-binding MarR family transcriptional regulator
MAPARKSTASPRRAKTAPARSADSEAHALATYARRGPECAYANVRMLGRIVGAFYDEALKPVDLRASQLALLWAILACEPVDRKTLERVTRTDQTTLSRTVEHLRAQGLVITEAAADRRTRMIRLSPRGQRAFLRAMPHWEQAQRDIDAWLALPQLARLAKVARALGDEQDAR